MQQVATQLGMFSPIALQFGAYSAYTQAVSTDPWDAGPGPSLFPPGIQDQSPLSQGQHPELGGEPDWVWDTWPHPPLLPFPQLMQQQAALVAAHSAYLSPMATMAAVQMQHMAAINANGLIATPITPSSGKTQARQAGLGVNRTGEMNYHIVCVCGGHIAQGSHRVWKGLRGESGLLPPFCPQTC